MALPFRTANNTRAEHLSDHNTLHAWYNNLVLGNFVADSIFISASGESTFDMDAAGAEWSTTGDMWLIADGTLSFTDSVGELTLNDIRNGLGGGGGGSGTGFTEAAPDQWVFMPTDPVAIAIVASNATTSSIVQISADASAGFITTADGSMSQVQALGVGSTAMLTAPTGTASVIGDDVNIDAVGLIDIDAGELSVVTPDGTLEMYGAGVVDLIAVTTLNLTAGTGEVQFTDGLGTITLDEIRTDMAGGGGGGISIDGAGANSVAAAHSGDTVTATGSGSIAIGNTATATQTNAVSMGVSADATGTGAVSIGPGSEGSAASATAVGRNATANQTESSAFGFLAQATGTNAVALGYSAAASGADSIVIGPGAASSANAIAIGESSMATTGAGAIAIGGGQSSTAAPWATAQGAIAIGASNASGVAGARASGANSVAIGGGDASVVGASATGANAISLGRGTVSSNTNTTAVGVASVASANSASAYGVAASASALNSTALGSAATTAHATSTAIGYSATTTAANQIMLGTASETVYFPGGMNVDGDAVTTGAWTAFTPTLVQSGAVTKTVTYARYMRFGRLIVAQVRLLVTGTGTAANNVVIGLPVAAESNNGRPWGVGEIYDSSATLLYQGNVISLSTTTVGIRAPTAGAATLLGAASFTAALDSGDDIGYSITYEAAS